MVAQLQAEFLKSWVTATGRVLHGQTYLLPSEAVVTQAAQAFTSSLGGVAESMQLMVFMPIAAARSSLAL